ncbi:Mechanosensitive channel MscK precursor [Novipirellula aureliae]|uniref:Mechanosensitive channel MscK n=1 Tax=Novipirellula aureliae TaxID=2527966 RepID=A0A5C6DH81_9BACT|nr:mechanosensitive ion channel domain-containing protein [Novipirellula aureliae]TWU36683.1 Mechanosensitive channel MscK precursor [Novipirellula aureliae]
MHSIYKGHRRRCGISKPSLLIALLTNVAICLFLGHRCSAQSMAYTPNYPIRDSSSLVQPIEDRSVYRLANIESARHSATQFRSLARQTISPAAKLAEENARFADQWADLAEAHNHLSRVLSETNTKLNDTRQDLEDIRLKIDHYGLSPTIGLLLQQKKEQLDAWMIEDSQSLFTSEELKRARSEQLELDMIHFDGSNPITQADELLAGEPKTAERLTDNATNPSRFQRSADRHLSLNADIRQLLTQRYEWLKLLRQGYQEYQQKLGQLDTANTATRTIFSEYSRLIHQNILWIRSGEPLRFADIRQLDDGVAAVFDSQHSAILGHDLKRKWDADPVAGLRLLATILLLIIIRWRSKTWLVAIGQRKRMKDASDQARQLSACLLTVLTALTLPTIFFVTTRWLGHGLVSESILSMATAVAAAGWVSLIVEIPRQLLRNNGLIHHHVAIELPGQTRAVKFLTLIGAGLILVAYLLTRMRFVDHGVHSGSIARIGFLLAMLVVAWTFHRAFKPKGGFLEPMIATFAGAVIYRLRLIPYLIGIGFPFAMITLSALGYEFTANELIKKAIITLSSLMIAATLWPAVKIASAHIWQRLTGPKPVRQFDEYGEIKPDVQVGTLGEHFLELKHQLAFLCQCALVLLTLLCLAWLWVDVFPNVRMGNPVVWNIEDTVITSSIDVNGQPISQSVIETTPVTAMHLLLATASLFVAFQFAKLLPALFDALVLQRVSFDEAMEHMSLVIGRCLLFGIGCFVACRLVGIRWHSIQWLAVGLTIGLGFGLQDMVRNLFGGLVVLFEKPARLGDLISVGKVTGRVSMQRLRTTVISDDEGREVIIPNKNFVSEEVINWMAAGRLSQIPIEVAVTRNERPVDICRTLQELVIEQPEVLLTPAPQATLVCVGRKSQRIEVIAWIEQSKDVSRFRDSLLKTVRSFLRERNQLATEQPPQPSFDRKDQKRSNESYRDIGRPRRRSA